MDLIDDSYLIDFNTLIQKGNKFMLTRQRQFSEIRSRASSRCHSQKSNSNYSKQKPNILYPSTHQNHDCVNCINKKLVLSKKEQIKRKEQQQINKHLDTIKKINSMRDYQQQHRQKMLLESARYNKSLAISQKESLKKLKKGDNVQAKVQNEKKQRQFSRNQQDYKRSRRQLESKYHDELKNQVQQQKSRRQLQLSRSKFQDPQKVNKLKVIEENDKYVNMINEQRLKCQKQNKKLIYEKSFQKYEEKQKSLIEDKRHMQRVNEEFKGFTEFQPLQQCPYRMSRSILSSSENPEDNVFSHLKNIQTQKKLTKITQRKLNNTQRMMDLKKQEEENRAMMQKKLTSMKSYVQDLTNQLLQKRQRQVQLRMYTKYYQPQKSKTDYYTEQLGKKIEQCHSCEKKLQQKYFMV